MDVDSTTRGLSPPLQLQNGGFPDPDVTGYGQAKPCGGFEHGFTILIRFEPLHYRALVHAEDRRSLRHGVGDFGPAAEMLKPAAGSIIVFVIVPHINNGYQFTVDGFRFCCWLHLRRIRMRAAGWDPG